MIPPSTRVYVATSPTDLRKGFDGLSAAVTAQGLDPASVHAASASNPVSLCRDPTARYGDTPLTGTARWRDLLSVVPMEAPDRHGLCGRR